MSSTPPEYDFKGSRKDPDGYGWSINEWLLVAILLAMIWMFIC